MGMGGGYPEPYPGGGRMGGYREPYPSRGSKGRTGPGPVPVGVGYRDPYDPYFQPNIQPFPPRGRVVPTGPAGSSPPSVNWNQAQAAETLAQERAEAARSLAEAARKAQEDADAAAEAARAEEAAAKLREEEIKRLEEEVIASRERAQASAQTAAEDASKALEAERAAERAMAAQQLDDSAPGKWYSYPSRGPAFGGYLEPYQPPPPGPLQPLPGRYGGSIPPGGNYYNDPNDLNSPRGRALMRNQAALRGRPQ